MKANAGRHKPMTAHKSKHSKTAAEGLEMQNVSSPWYVFFQFCFLNFINYTTGVPTRAPEGLR